MFVEVSVIVYDEPYNEYVNSRASHVEKHLIPRADIVYYNKTTGVLHIHHAGESKELIVAEKGRLALELRLLSD